MIAHGWQTILTSISAWEIHTSWRTKGGIDAIVIPVVSAGGLTAVIELVRSWLTRDRTRSLKVSWSNSGAVESIELSGAEVDSNWFEDLLRAVTQTLAAGP